MGGQPRDLAGQSRPVGEEDGEIGRVLAGAIRDLGIPLEVPDSGGKLGHLGEQELVAGHDVHGLVVDLVLAQEFVGVEVTRCGPGHSSRPHKLSHADLARRGCLLDPVGSESFGDALCNAREGFCRGPEAWIDTHAIRHGHHDVEV